MVTMDTCFDHQANRSAPIVEAVFYRDLLCPRCHLAAARLEQARRQVGPCFSWRIRPFPLGEPSVSPDPEEVEAAVRAIEDASREPGAPPMSSSPWTKDEAPGPSLFPLAAVEAASFQGAGLGRALDSALRNAAFERGLDVSRLEVVLDLARELSSTGLDLARLRRDLRVVPKQRWRDRLIDRRNDGARLGVKRPPAILVNERLLSGVCEVAEYVDAIAQALAGSVRNQVDGPAA